MEFDISVIIPCYNEKGTILTLLNKVRAVSIPKEIIVVCDGSTDGTRELLEEEYRTHGGPDFKVLYSERTNGKGSSIRMGLSVAEGEIVIIQDADLELNPEDYFRLLQPFKDGAQVVFGSRFRMNKPKIALYSHFANWCVTFLSNVLYGAKLTDAACCYKVMRLELYRSLRLECNGFDFCPEVTSKVRKKGYSIVEVPVQFNPRSFKEGKKIQWKHGFEAVWKLIKYRFSSFK